MQSRQNLMIPRTCPGRGSMTASEMSDETPPPRFPWRGSFPMLLYDDTAAEALHAAADEARRPGATRYETANALLGLLRTADPFTQTVTGDYPQLTVDAARAVGAPPMQNPE